MKENTREKSLIKVNENSIFHKIKSFIRKLFHKDKEKENDISIEATSNDSILKNENIKSTFTESMKVVKDDNSILLELQKKYRSGEIKEEDLTKEEKNSLCALYDKQIANLKKSNEIRKTRILQYIKKLPKED